VSGEKERAEGTERKKYRQEEKVSWKKLFGNRGLNYFFLKLILFYFIKI